MISIVHKLLLIVAAICTANQPSGLPLSLAPIAEINVDDGFRIADSRTTIALWNRKEIRYSGVPKIAFRLASSPVSISSGFRDFTLANGTALMLERTRVLRSVDWTTWNQVFELPARFDARVLAVDSQNIWVAGAKHEGRANLDRLPNVAVDADGNTLTASLGVFRSQSFTELRIPSTTGAVEEVRICDSTILIRTHFQVLVSTDSGAKWFELGPAVQSDSKVEPPLPTALACSSSKELWIGYSDRSIVKQTAEYPARKTFARIAAGEEGGITKLYFVNSKLGYGLVDGELWATLDGGSNWKPLKIPDLVVDFAGDDNAIELITRHQLYTLRPCR